jgi:hypothetical protein
MLLPKNSPAVDDSENVCKKLTLCFKLLHLDQSKKICPSAFNDVLISEFKFTVRFKRPLYLSFTIQNDVKSLSLYPSLVRYPMKTSGNSRAMGEKLSPQIQLRRSRS